MFLTLSLLNRCQIVTDTFKEMLQSLLASHLNHLFHYTNKNISVKPLFNLHYLSLFQLPFTRSKNCSAHGGSCRNYSPKSVGYTQAPTLRYVLYKRTCIHLLISMKTPCHLWQGKIPLARLSQSQRPRQKLLNIQFPSLFCQLQAM